MPDRSFVLEDEEQGTFRVDRESLTSDDVYRLETSEIFDRCWLYVGHESEVQNPNDFVCRTIAGRPVILCRGEDKAVQVFLNTCLHRGAEVCRDTEGNSRIFQCFYHAWTYNTSGELIGVPDAEAYKTFDREEMRLATPPKVDTYRGFVFVCFDDSRPSLVEYLGAAAEWIDRVADQSEVGMEIVSGTHDYAIDANWKLLVENSLDGYHLGPLHRTYFDYVRETEGDVSLKRPTRAIDLGGGHAVIIDQAPWGRPVARWVPSFGEEAKGLIEDRRQSLVDRFGEERAEHIANRDCNLLVFPNLVINDVMAVVVRTIWPTSSGSMRVYASALSPVDDTSELRKTTLQSFVSFLGPGGFATPDDMEALESCQRGLATHDEVRWSDLSRGMGKPESEWTSADEGQARAFWRRWQNMIDGTIVVSAT